MSNEENLDPIRLWRDWFVKSEKMWSDVLTDAMGNEQFSKGMGRYVHEALHTHRMFSEAMGQYLANLNIPSRADILDIGDRLSHVEDTLAQIQLELREQRALIARVSASAGLETERKRPSRTKQPEPTEE